MPYDGVVYLRCSNCGEYVVDGEAEAHEQCCGTRFVCRVCGDGVKLNCLREHLARHNPNAMNLEPGKVHDQFMAT
jgi:hypothetical protein